MTVGAAFRSEGRDAYGTQTGLGNQRGSRSLGEQLPSEDSIEPLGMGDGQGMRPEDSIEPLSENPWGR